MKYSDMIQKLMTEVENGGDVPMLIYRDADGGWQADFTRNQHGENFAWVKDAIENDKAAFVARGQDFAGGSYLYVYDKVLSQRMRNEYNAVQTYDHSTEHRKLYALLNFFEDNAAGFSQEVMDYLIDSDRPLETLSKLCPFNMATAYKDWSFNEDLAPDAIDQIEQRVASINEALINKNRHAREVLLESGEAPAETRTADGCKVIACVDIGGVRSVLSDNPDDPYSYIVHKYNRNNDFGIEECTYRVDYNDYVDAVFWFNNSMMNQVEALQAERKERKASGVERCIMEESDCVPGGLDENIKGKLIIIKPEVLAPEYRYSDYQLRTADGGFGCSPNSRGSAVFCTDLYSGKQSRFERHDILGVADLAKLPEWAKAKLGLAAENVPAPEPPKEQDKPKNYTLIVHGQRDEINLGTFATVAEAKQYAAECDIKNFSIKKLSKESLLGNLDKNKAKVAQNKAASPATPKKSKQKEVGD